MSAQEKVVVLGAGFAGINVAKSLQDQRDVVLVAPTDRFVYLPMIHEVLSETALPRDVTLELADVVPKARHVHGRAERVDGDGVETSGGDAIPFDRLVVAIGAQPDDFGIPGVTTHALSFYSVGNAMRANGELKAAATRVEGPLKVTIVGASFTGVEVAGEVADLLDAHDVDREVRLLEARKNLFPHQSERFQRGVLEGLDRLDLDLELGAMVEEVRADEIVAEQEGHQRTWSSDVTFWCAGVKPRSVEGINARVEPTLTSKSREDVFVVGDAARFPDGMQVPKLAQTAEDQADVAVHNVLNPDDPVRYEPHVRGLVVSIGQGYAVAELSHGPVFKGRIPWHVKRNLYKAKMTLA